MFCKHCGQEIPDKAVMCASCQQPTGVPLNGTPPANYLVFAILATVFCCLPLGIPAIVFAAQVNGKYVSGDVEGARRASDRAKLWCWLSLAVGLLSYLGYVAAMALGALSQAAALN